MRCPKVLIVFHIFPAQVIFDRLFSKLTSKLKCEHTLEQIQALIIQLASCCRIKGNEHSY